MFLDIKRLYQEVLDLFNSSFQDMGPKKKGAKNNRKKNGFL